MKTVNISKLKSLGSNTTIYQFDHPSKDVLETFKNPDTKNPYLVLFSTPEFTSLCPKTGQPDHGKIKIVYAPKKVCIESKSLKLYLMQYRNHGAFMESIVSQILNDCFEVCKPVSMRVIGIFNARGGVKTVVKSFRSK